MRLAIEVADEFNFKLIEPEHSRQLVGEPQFLAARGPQAVGYLTLTNSGGAVIRYALMLNPATGVLKLVPALPKAALFDSMSQAEVLDYAAGRKDPRRDTDKEAD